MNNETLNQVFSNTANSIRTKTGSQASITPINFANSILNIPASYDDIYRINVSENIYNIPNPKNEDICVVVEEGDASTLEYHTIEELSPISKLQLLESFTLPENYTKPSAVYPSDPKEQWINTVFRGTISSSSLNFVIYKDNTAYIKVKLGSTEDYSIVYNYISTDGLHFTLTDRDIPELVEDYIDLETNIIDTSKLNYTITKTTDISRFTPAVGYMIKTIKRKYVDDIYIYNNSWEYFEDIKIVSSIEELYNLTPKNNMYAFMTNGGVSCLYKYSNNSWAYPNIGCSVVYQGDSIDATYYADSRTVLTDAGPVRGTFYAQNAQGPTIRKMRQYYNNLANYCQNITNASYLFYGCNNVTNIRNSLWYSYMPLNNMHPISTVFMLAQCSNLTSIENFDTSLSTNTVGMFYGCTNLTSIPNFNFSNTTNIARMFYNCRKLTSIPSTINSNTIVSSLGETFTNCTNIKTIPQLNTEGVENFYMTFYSCSNISSIPNLDYNSLNYAYEAFGGTNITSIENLVIPNGGEASYMFHNCTKLTSIKNTILNIHNGCYMFYKCANLTTIQNLTLIEHRATFPYSSTMFIGCLNISSIKDSTFMIRTGLGRALGQTPNLHTLENIKLINACDNTFINSANLKNISNLDCSEATTIDYIFQMCNNLTNDSLNEILKTCINAVKIKDTSKSLLNNVLTDTSYTPEQIQSLPSYQDFINAGWTL